MHSFRSASDGGGTLKSLQILRFIAGISVVYHHIYVPANFGVFGVDIFFVLSGFVIALVVSNKQPASVFAISRFARIVPIYWLLTTLLFLAIYTMPHYISATVVEGASLGGYLKSLFFIPYLSGHEIKPILRLGWTLNYEMFFYLCVWLSMLLWRGHALKLAFALLLFCYAVFGFLLPNKVANGFFGSVLIFEFALGVLAHQIWARGLLKHLPVALLLAVCLGAYGFLAYAEFHLYWGGSNRLMVFGIPAFLLVLCAVELEKALAANGGKIISALISMGDASYATYLTHWYVMVVLRKIGSEQLGLFPFYSPLGTVITLAACLLVGQLTYLWLDKPLHKGLKRYLLKQLTPTRS